MDTVIEEFNKRALAKEAIDYQKLIIVAQEREKIAQEETRKLEEKTRKQRNSQNNTRYISIILYIDYYYPQH
jgi:hypothetical protein